MKIAIYGVNKMAVYLLEQFEIYYSDLHNVECIIDDNSENIGKVINGLQVISFEQFKEHHNKNIDAILIAATGSKSRLEITQLLRNKSTQKIGCSVNNLYKHNEKLIIDEQGNSNSIVWLDDISKPILAYLEINVVDECNLKCKGCTHFANLFNEVSRYDLEKFKQDITVISNNCYVLRVRLLGGEPLLCNNLYEYLDFAREKCPNIDISVVTNGLLISKQSDKLFECMRRNNIDFRISLYPPTIRIKDKISSFLIEKSVKFNFVPELNDVKRDPILKFSKILSSAGNSDPLNSMKRCTSDTCRFLRNGKLYKCPIEGLIYKFFDTYNISNDLECGIDIYKVTNWNESINELNTKPVDACRYCTETPELMDWAISATPEMNDWIVKKKQ